MGAVITLPCAECGALLSGARSPVALRGWDDWLAAGGTVDCHLARHPDFDLELPAADLVGAGSSLLMLDGDTVMATSRDMTRGIVLDLCADGAIEQIDVDVWG